MYANRQFASNLSVRLKSNSIALFWFQSLSSTNRMDTVELAKQYWMQLTRDKFCCKKKHVCHQTEQRRVRNLLSYVISAMASTAMSYSPGNTASVGQMHPFI
jgi:hypothetical protein